MFLPIRLTVRVTEDLLKEIEVIIEKDNGEKYDNISHFIRCAALKLIRDENDTTT